MSDLYHQVAHLQNKWKLVFRFWHEVQKVGCMILCNGLIVDQDCMFTISSPFMIGMATTVVTMGQNIYLIIASLSTYYLEYIVLPY